MCLWLENSLYIGGIMSWITGWTNDEAEKPKKDVVSVFGEAEDTAYIPDRRNLNIQ